MQFQGNLAVVIVIIILFVWVSRLYHKNGALTHENGQLREKVAELSGNKKKLSRKMEKPAKTGDGSDIEFID